MNKKNSLTLQEVHIWKAKLSDWVDYGSLFSSWLDQDETDRWARYKIAAKKQDFLISRGILRIVLSRYLDLQPENIQLSSTADGKPYHPGSAINFNLSHSGDNWIGAITKLDACGVDIEAVSLAPDPDKLTKKVLHPAEQQYLDCIDQRSVYQREFLSIWTAKEAYLKARGLGLKEYPNWFSVLPDPQNPGSFILNDPRLQKLNQDWTILRLQLSGGYLGAVAVNKMGIVLKTERILPADLPDLALNSSYPAAAGSMPD